MQIGNVLGHIKYHTKCVRLRHAPVSAYGVSAPAKTARILIIVGD
jgi:hypothetical protein